MLCTKIKFSFFLLLLCVCVCCFYTSKKIIYIFLHIHQSKQKQKPKKKKWENIYYIFYLQNLFKILCICQLMFFFCICIYVYMCMYICIHAYRYIMNYEVFIFSIHSFSIATGFPFLLNSISELYKERLYWLPLHTSEFGYIRRPIILNLLQHEIV